MESASLILLAVAILAAGALVSPKPSLSATLLFLESILINGLIIFHTKDLTIIGTSILLSFFIMITIGANYYLEISVQTKFKPSKFGMLIGAFSLFVFWKNCKNFSMPEVQTATELTVFKPYLIEILIVGFTLFSILVSTITILCIKNPKRGSSI